LIPGLASSRNHTCILSPCAGKSRPLRIFIFLVAWDEFFYALIFTSTLAAKTAPVAIAEFVGRYAVNITGMMAGGILAAMPPVILALIFQRYIVTGLTAGAVKG
jgi:multiple sugar transport system permease protein